MNSAYFTTAFQQFPDAIIVVDRMGEIRYVNDRMLDLFHYSDGEEVLGRGIWELSANFQDDYHKEAQEAALEMIALAEKRGFIEFEWKHARQGDRVFHAEVNLKRVMEGETDLFVSSVRDITRRKQLEDNLKELTRKADESSQQKLEFLSNMSHEIRSPLNVIIGFTELLELSDVSQKDYREYVEIIRTNGNMLQRLIEDIIDVSKIETNKLKVVKTNFKVNDIMNEIYQSFSLADDAKDVQFVLDIPDGNEDLNLNSDPYRLKQILTNLFTNAKKFTEKGEVRIGYQLIGTKELEFYVSDTGKGIAEDDLRLIFSRFEQANSIDINEIKGFGLGLAISRGLTHIMGGKIAVESELGKGSRFSVRFPITSGKSDKKEKKSKSALDLTGIQILIAEDVFENFEFLNALFKRTNASITWAKNGQEAVEYVKNQPFDLVLMDIKMPIMNGYEALEVIRKTHISLPIIAQTAYALDFDRSKGLAAGFNDYISKPIRVELLFEKIATLLEIKGADKR